MALVENTMLGSIDKIQIAIDRIKEFQPKDRPYLLGFSGGKDALVCYDLAKRANVDFIAQHAPTIEFKETFQYIRNMFPDVVQIKPQNWSRSKREYLNGKPKTMFTLIASRKIPPTRQNPYCCSHLKENVGGVGDTIILGVRAAESKKRNNRSMISFWQGKTTVNPIIDWTDDEVWEYIHKYGLPYNPLYDNGFCRVGCPGCPKSSHQKWELEQFPKWRNFYLTAFKHMLKNYDGDRERTWKTPEDVMHWWLGECEKQRQELEGQCEFM